MDKRYWIWVHDKTTGNKRWAKNSDDSEIVPISLEDAIRKCADWSTRAVRHEYSVKAYATAIPRKVLVTVEVEL